MSAASPALIAQMSEIPYDPKFDPRPKDYFGPIKTNNTVQLPKSVKINYPFKTAKEINYCNGNGKLPK